jgi:hypothetical protein
MTKAILPTAAVITLIICLLFYDAIARLILVVGYGLLLTVGALAIGTGFFGSWLLAEKIRMIRASRIQAEKAAHVMVVSDNGETWVRDTDKRATWKNLTGTPALYVNGTQSIPQEWEIELHRLKLATLAPKAAPHNRLFRGRPNYCHPRRLTC